MLNVQQVRLRFIFARALYLHRLFAKALEVCIYFVAANKLVFDVSEPPWMGVVLSRNEFVKTNSQLTNVQDVHFLPCLRVFFVRS